MSWRRVNEGIWRYWSTGRPRGFRSKRQRDHASGIAGLAVHGNHGRLGEKVEFRGAGPGVGAHGAAHDEVTRLELRQHEVLGDHVDAVAGGTGEHGREFLVPLLE